MPSIQIEPDQRAAVNAAHAEYTGKTGAIEAIVEGGPVFSGTVQTGMEMIVSDGFASFLKAKRIACQFSK